MGVSRRIDEEEKLHYTEEHPEPCQTSEMERLAK